MAVGDAFALYASRSFKTKGGATNTASVSKQLIIHSLRRTVLNRKQMYQNFPVQTRRGVVCVDLSNCDAVNQTASGFLSLKFGGFSITTTYLNSQIKTFQQLIKKEVNNG